MNSPVEAIKSEKRLLLIEYLKKNHRRYKTLFSDNEDSIFVLDIEGHVVQSNPAFQHLTGYSQVEADELRLQFLFPIDHINKVFHHFSNAVLGRFPNFDTKIITKIGQILDLNITFIPICEDDQIVGVSAIGKDITDLKRKKEEIRKIEEMQRVLTDNILDVIVSTNLQGEIVYVSPSCEYILGYDPDEVMKENLLSFVHPDDVEKAYQSRKQVLDTQESGRDCYRVQKKNGEYLWVESLCKPIIAHDTLHVLEIVSVIRDVTDRIKVEEEAKRREETYHDLVEHSPDAVIIAKDSEILFINETGARLFGAKNKQDILHRSLSEIIHPNFLEMAKERGEMVAKGTITEFIEYQLLRLDGTTFVAEVKGIPTFYENTFARHIIIRDVTERKKTHELLVNSEKLNVAGQLAAGIAHEVRNPLTAIKGFLQLMETEDDGNKSYFDIIQSEMDRIELILSELLVIAKPHELKFEAVDLITLLENVKTLIETQAVINGIQIETIFNYHNFTINCDKNQLKQVFINILKNAVEAMPKGGFITMEVKQYGCNMVKIFFKDTGYGMPPEILKRVGEPFFTTKEDGTGLGIMISKQIVENHGGTINIWSDQQGTMIEVLLPIASVRLH
ncbi:PAS domain-containing sensor histidine kinase [Neobacillus cucumis]|uniref:histidine kinase n=1 Tax=Neobacillus cucumis TaxID=1740721 RepID=A0A2N5HAS9_9BACI|nr:PAS domain-containing sensor histidine kinase [Neobacillus cucumis]PLS02614.1 PAS domain-containing sensor histidine kinase [Neobacillus cucumis]